MKSVDVIEDKRQEDENDDKGQSCGHKDASWLLVFGFWSWVCAKTKDPRSKTKDPRPKYV
jgi:hypothetical protein